MDFLRQLRSRIFRELGKTRFRRIVFCIFIISVFWCFTDWLGGHYKPMLRDDLICVVLGIIAERLIPWGKQKDTQEEATK